MHQGIQGPAPKQQNDNQVDPESANKTAYGPDLIKILPDLIFGHQPGCTLASKCKAQASLPPDAPRRAPAPLHDGCFALRPWSGDDAYHGRDGGALVDEILLPCRVAAGGCSGLQAHRGDNRVVAAHVEQDAPDAC